MYNGRKSTKYTAQTDIALWTQVRDDSCTTSFSYLFDRYWSTVYSSSFRYLQDRERCEEITHDIFLNIWQKRANLHIESFPAYLRASARYQVYKELKKNKSAWLEYSEDLPEHDSLAVSNAGEEKLHYEEASRYIHDSLRSLPVRCQEIYALSRSEQLSNEEIAHRLGISKRSVENQLTVALRHIRIQLKTIGMLVLIWWFL